MKTAFSSFIYSRRGIYGILHILILLMSLFLVISISIDTFHNIPFLNQGSYLKIQFWICMFFLFDFLLEFFLSKEKGRYFTSHFIFLLVSIPYLNIIDFYHITFSPEISYFLRFIPLLRGGYALAIVVGWLSGSKASGLFTSYITMLMATVYFASLIFFVLEHKVNPMVTDYWSALPFSRYTSPVWCSRPTSGRRNIINRNNRSRRILNNSLNFVKNKKKVLSS